MTEATAQHSENSSFLPRSRSARVRDCEAQLSSPPGTVNSRPSSDPVSQRSDAGNLTASVAITPMASFSCRKRRASLSPSDITNSATAILMSTPKASVGDLSKISRKELSSIVLHITPDPQQKSKSKKARSHSPVRQEHKDSVLPSRAIIVDSVLASNKDNGRFTQSSTAPFDPDALKRHLVKRSSITLKKLAHRTGIKPVAEIIEHLPNEDAAMALFKGIQSTTNTNGMIKWNLNGNEEINSWLEKKDKYIHPVEIGDWCILWGAVYNPTYAWAKFDSCEANFDKSKKILRLKFKTFLYATGKDENGRPSCIQ